MELVGCHFEDVVSQISGCNAQQYGGCRLDCTTRPRGDNRHIDAPIYGQDAHAHTTRACTRGWSADQLRIGAHLHESSGELFDMCFLQS